MPLGGSANRRVTRHVRHATFIEHTEPNSLAHAGCRTGGLTSSVSCSNDDNVKVSHRYLHQNWCSSVTPIVLRLLPDAEMLKDVVEQVVGCASTRDFLKSRSGPSQIGKNEFLRYAFSNRLCALVQRL